MDQKLYNPDAMPEDSVKTTFVARQPLLEELCRSIAKQPDRAGMQHIVIVAPRGMGKTTLLLMLKFAVNEGELGNSWITVKFPEESYGVYDLADFFLETVRLLATEADDHHLAQQAEQQVEKHPNSDELLEITLKLIRNWRRRHGKRLLLLVENFDLILEQINNEYANAYLLDLLMNDDTFMLIGGATTYFRETRAREQPLYRFFKIYDLDLLGFEQMQELLRKRAELDGIEGFDKVLKTNRSRLRAMEYFTRGNPRLVLILYRVVTQSAISEVRKVLEQLLDEVTPYYKAKVEVLPPQQRKILDHIARESSLTGEGVTTGNIARAVRLPANQVSVQLKRLQETGYVHHANVPGRSSYYVLSEPLFAIWYQMRFGRNARTRMLWLVNFLKVWYGVDEFKIESKRLSSRFRNYLDAGHLSQARDVLEHQRYLAAAIDDQATRSETMENVIRGHLILQDRNMVQKELLGEVKLEVLSADTLARLHEDGYIDKSQYKKILSDKTPADTTQSDTEFAEAIALALSALYSRNYEEAARNYERALKIKPQHCETWTNLGIALSQLGRHRDALASWERALKIDPDYYKAWANRGVTLEIIARFEEAIKSYDRALKIKPDYQEVWASRGVALYDLARYRDAIRSYDEALRLRPQDHETWYNRGNAFVRMGRDQDAIDSYDHAVKIKPDYHEAWYNRGNALMRLNRYQEAISSYDHAVMSKPDKYEAWTNRGISFDRLGQHHKAVISYDRALKIKPDYHEAWYNRGNAMDWLEAIRGGRPANDERWLDETLQLLTEVAEAGHVDFVRQIIEKSNLGERFFPLTRAIDYLESGNEAIIEKLSPEVRNIVKEVVERISDSVKQPGSGSSTPIGRFSPPDPAAGSTVG